MVYAQYGLAGDQEELRAKLAEEAILKEISHLQANMMNCLHIWRRCHEGNPKTALDALKRMVEFRSEENRLLRQLLGIDAEKLALPKA
jgi:hypothetical protein